MQSEYRTRDVIIPYEPDADNKFSRSIITPLISCTLVKSASSTERNYAGRKNVFNYDRFVFKLMIFAYY